MKHIELLRNRMKEKGIDAFLCYDELNQKYLSGFAFTDGALLITADRTVMITDFRYLEHAQKEAYPCFEVTTPENRTAFITDVLHEAGARVVGLEGRYLPFGDYERIKERYPDFTFVDIDNTVEVLRRIKTEEELAFMQKAQDITDLAFSHILKVLTPNMTEIDVAAELECIDIWNNSTAVQKYKTTSLNTITSTNVIIESGSEFRVCALRTFYVFNNTTDTEPWGYRGEKTFAASILAVAQAESPIACVTVNHSETFSDYELLNTLQDAGYKVQTIDLAYQEIPEDCRLIVIYNPKEDFIVKDGVSDVSEIEKIDRYLDGLSCSLMVFVNPETPKLKNLEEYLEEWGVVIDRYTDQLDDTYNYVIKESSDMSLSTDGFAFSGTYAEMGIGAGFHDALRESAYPPSIVFKNSTSISYSDLYEEKIYSNDDETQGEVGEYKYATYSKNGVVRAIYDVFTTSKNAEAMANGIGVANASTEPFKLMTVTRESQMVTGEDEDYATVMVCTSTEFASEAMLSSATYGNADLLLSAARGMGKEFIPVDLELKPFASTVISGMSTQMKNRYTVLLAVIPAALVVGVGVFVLVRRKYS